MLRKIVKFIGILAAILVLLVILLFGSLTILEYKPAPEEPCAVAGSASQSLRSGDSIDMVIWNVGYGALGDNADFFMDGGSSVYTADKTRVTENITAISDWLKASDSDLILLQELDRNSSRSRHVAENDMIEDALGDGYVSSFANNYKAVFVPYPLPPIGKVDSGIETFSRYGIDSSVRISLPCPFSWPIRVANLKRCLLVSRIPVEGTDKALVVVNLHLEAYDDGQGKIAQTEQLAQLLNEEREKGNYVIAGGDFNQMFSNIDTTKYPADPSKWLPGIIETDHFGSGWTHLMDAAVPTCRSLDQAYAGADPETFQYYLIDGFIVSANLTVKDCSTQDLGFVHSDHNPVKLTVQLNK